MHTHDNRTITSTALIALIVVALGACGGSNHQRSQPAAMQSAGGETVDPNDTAATGKAKSASKFTEVATIANGLNAPESAVYDSAGDQWFVSNINGQPFAKDHNGYISRVGPDGTVKQIKFIASGQNGAELNAPKGLCITGDTLWVADIDVVRAFNKNTGKPITTVSFADQGAKLLNAIAQSPVDHAIYITDTGLEPGAGPNSQPKHVGPDRIFKITPGGEGSIAIQSKTLEGPNGITWDGKANHFIIVSFTGKHIVSWKPGQTAATVLASGPGQFDGAEWMGDEETLVSSWADSSLFLLHNGSLNRVIAGGLPTPADLHVDFKRHNVAIPLSSANRVEMFSIPTSVASK